MAAAAPERTVPLGRLEPLKIAVVPAFVGLWAAMGPGVIWAALAQGSGEIIWWPYLTAKYGATFLGLLLPACLMQYWVNQEIIRYTATTGETFFTGLTRIHKALAIFMWFMMLITFLWFGGYASAGATALFELTRFPPGWGAREGTLFWTYLTIAVFFAALVLGRVVYNIIERFMMAVTIVTVVGLVIAVLQPTVLSQAGAFFANYLNPFTVLGGFRVRPWDPKDADIVLTSIAFAGMGGFFNVLYSYWIRDKGLGMAKYIGRVTSPITGKPEAIPATGYAFEDTPENRKNYLDWIRYLRIDNAIGVGVNAFTVMLMCWLAWSILLPRGEFPSGWRIAVVQSAFFETAMGSIGRALFLLVAAAFLADSWLGITDGVSRMHADFFYANFAWARRLHFRTLYYIFVVLLTVISCTTVLLAAPGPLLIAGGVLNYISMAIYMPFLIYLNYFLVPKRFPAWTRPANATLVIASIVSAIYIVLGIIYILFRVFGVRLLF